VLCSVYRRIERLKFLLHKGLRCSVKKWKTSGLFGGQKGFLFFEVYHHMKILSKFILISSYSSPSEKIRRVNFLHHGKGNSPVELCGNV